MANVIKVLKDTKAISPLDTIVSKYEVVTILDQNEQGILVKNILDEFILLPVNTVYKVIKNKKIKSYNISQIYKALKQTKVMSEVEVTAGEEYDPYGPQPFAPFGIKIKRKPKEKANPALVRIVQKIQIICSNALSTDNVLEMNKLVLAAICANVAGTTGLNNASVNRLIQLTNKLIASSSNK